MGDSGYIRILHVKGESSGIWGDTFQKVKSNHTPQVPEFSKAKDWAYIMGARVGGRWKKKCGL